MKTNQLPGWRNWGRHVHELAGNCTRHPSEMWVLTEHGDRILGCTTILRTAAPWIWTTGEAADTAYYLNGTITDPAERHRKLGTLIAHWAVDRAAREGISRVRRDCSSPTLASYYLAQNFQLIRRVPMPGGRMSYALERSSERIPTLAAWLSRPGHAGGSSRRQRMPSLSSGRSNVATVARIISRTIQGVAGAQLPMQEEATFENHLGPTSNLLRSAPGSYSSSARVTG
ncbi:GNAT family N-acetyltransferase [Streptomyces sp. bgisy060]|uniref:GNAT family N-acetyltransferase n=1 Tax=Streptomyces sp. bgisy060 TaxID=3413775 RepID=UPI003EBD479D